MSLYVQMTRNKGRGVFTDEPIRRGQTVMSCPVIPMSSREWHNILDTILINHVFTWPGPRQATNGYQHAKVWTGCAICLGLGSLINHDNEPNTVWVTNVPRKLIVFKAIRAICAGEELTHDYKWGTELWDRAETQLRKTG